jgi:hypothetical protein
VRTILNHPRWLEIARYLFAQAYGRDTSSNKIRHRIEVKSNAPTWLFSIEIDCAECQQPITPIRQRQSGGAYFAAACPHEVSRRCGNSKTTASEYVRIVDALHGLPVQHETSLFD